MSFDKMRIARWGKAEVTRISKLHASLSADDWKKKSLQGVRTKLRRQLMDRQRASCAYCRRQLSIEIGRNEIDHVAPKSVYSAYTYERINLVLTCKRCNSNKREHDPVAAPVIPGSIYPRGADSYLWVHPYVHRYSEHIKRYGGLIFEPIGTAHQKARAKAVISVCRLSKLATVQKRAMEEVVVRAEGDMQAVLAAVGTFPDADTSAMAKVLRSRLSSMRSKSLAEVERIVVAVRKGAADSFMRAMAGI